MNKQTDLKGHNNSILLCLYAADPATLLASNSVLGTLFSSFFINLLIFYQKNILCVWIPSKKRLEIGTMYLSETQKGNIYDIDKRQYKPFILYINFSIYFFHIWI